jgi:hypothetical protein
MDWTILYFQFQENAWLGRAQIPNSISAGHVSYAIQQATMYRQFAQQAKRAFVKTKSLSLFPEERMQ